MLRRTVCLLNILCLCVMVSRGAPGSKGSSMDVVNESRNATIDPAIMRVLHQVMETLESIRESKVKDLDRASQSLEEVTANAHNPTHVSPDDLPQGQERPVITKTYGYKVTVYATPVNESKERGGVGRNHYAYDLQPAESHVGDGYIRHGRQHGKGQTQGQTGHRTRSGEQEKGYERGQKDRKKTAKHSQQDNYHKSKGAHDKGLTKAAHSYDKYGHDRGAANERGLRERTEIEYFEREQFKKDQLDKTKLRQDHEKYRKANEAHEGSHKGILQHQASGGHYHNPHVHGLGKPAIYYVDGGGGYQRHGANKVLAQKERDGKLKDRTKKDSAEGLRERGFKITVEREVYLKDRQHDAGFGEHNRKLEKAAHDVGRHKNEEGERKVHGVKEDKLHENHESEYDRQKVNKNEKYGQQKGRQILYGETFKPVPPPPVHYDVLGYDQLYSSSNKQEDANNKADVAKEATVTTDKPLYQQYPSFGLRQRKRKLKGGRKQKTGRVLFPLTNRSLKLNEAYSAPAPDNPQRDNGQPQEGFVPIAGGTLNQAPQSLDNIRPPQSVGQQDLFAFNIVPAKGLNYGVYVNGGQYSPDELPPTNNIVYPAKNSVRFQLTASNQPVSWTSNNAYGQLLQSNDHISERADKKSA